MKQMYSNSGDEFMQEIDRLHALKYDVRHRTSMANLYSDPDGVDLVLRRMDPDGETANFFGKVSEPALKQMCETYDVPFSYVKTMRNRNQHELLAHNLNIWFQNKPEHFKNDIRFFRCYRKDGENPAIVRSFHSDRYKVFDNVDLMDSLRPTLAEVSRDLGSWEVVSCALTEKKLYMKIIFPEVSAYVDKEVGDIVKSGLVISNSEIGQGAVSVTRLLFRLACLNGMVLPDGKARSTHLGASQIEGEIDYKSDTKDVMNEALKLQLRDHIKAAVDGQKFFHSVAQMRQLATSTQAEEPEQALETLSEKFVLSEEETKKARRSLLSSGNFSAWGMVNSITNIANDVGDYDRASEIEVIGGKIAHHLSNAKNWRELALAA